MNSEQEQLHFIGVGGVGMSGIARVAHDQGMAVSGSDIKESRYTKQLRDAGVTVFIGQDGANIPDGDVTVVVSTAILENNPELIEARRRNLPIVHRAQMLARLGRDLDTLAVAGTGPEEAALAALGGGIHALGALPHEQIVQLLTQSDAYCLPTEYAEGFPTTLLEAAACRCPIVTTRTAGTDELLPGDDYAVFLANAAPETIRAGLETLLADPAAARTRAENARQNLCSHFTWQAVFATMMEAVTSAKRS